MNVAGQMQQWFRYWSGGGIVGIVIGIALAVVAVVLLAALWIPIAAIAISLAVARKRWPRVHFRAYFASKKVALPSIAAVCGFGIAIAAASLTSHEPETITTIVGGLMAAGALAALISIYEGKFMKSIFELVPAEQRAGFEERLAALDTAARGAEGQAVDLSGLDQSTVTAAIKERVIGHDAIVAAVVATAFRRARLAHARPNKPVAVFMLVGSTGGGKTYLAKVLAEKMFGNRLVRIDCNELSEESHVARLTGAPPGYIGSSEGSAFCREIGRLGTGLILFDEIEKAHPKVLKTIMGLLDEARITEQSTSRTYSARGFLIVLTSNAAQLEIGKIAQAETDPTSRSSKVKTALRNVGFLPEVLARIDTVFPFAQLSARAYAEIVEQNFVRFAGEVGVELVSVDSELLIGLVERAMRSEDNDVRDVVKSIEDTAVQGMFEVKDAGHQRVAIRVRDGHVSVEPAGA